MYCVGCQTNKEAVDFELNKRTQTYRKICRKCRNLQVMELRYSSLENHLKRKLSRLKERAKRLGQPFNLTYDDLYNQLISQDSKCFYSDEPLVFYEYKKIPHRRLAPSIDKVVPELGYVKGNVVWCIDRINKIKNDLTIEEMEKWTPLWHEKITHFLKIQR